MQYTLVTEGGSDRALLRPLDWLLAIHCRGSFVGQWANPYAMDDASRDLFVRMSQVQRYFPADLYFVHRDADASSPFDRRREIADALARSGCGVPTVCVIPVRMTEAWFLFRESAIRRAADRKHGAARLNLPDAGGAQRAANPKKLLEDALISACELHGRRLSQFRAELGRRKALVASNIDDFSPLRQHGAFQELEAELKAAVAAGGW